jgi:hypothetical protein
MCGCSSTIEDCGCESITLPTIHGNDGDSAYQVWLTLNPGGTVADYIEDITGEDGADGLSAYELAVQDGFVGNVTAWLASLNGTDGDPGDDGSPAHSTTTAVFTMPTGGSVTPLSLVDGTWAHAGLPIDVAGGNHLFVVSVTGNTLFVRQPTVANNGYVAAYNAIAGTQFPIGTHVTPRGRDGLAGDEGDPGTGGGTTDPDVPVVLARTTDAPEPGQFTRLAYDSGAWWIDRWNSVGGVWELQPNSLTGAPGSQILFLSSDPNGQPSSYGEIGDVVIQNQTNAVSFWQKTGAAVWSLRNTLTGAAVANIPDMFRVGKSAIQPVATGSTTATTLSFDVTSGTGYFNGGWWNGSRYDADTGVTANQIFRLEFLRIYREGGGIGDDIVFTVDIMHGAVVVATADVTIAGGETEGELVILVSSTVALTAASEVYVRITPDISPTSQWLVDFDGLVFYNQRA